MASDRDVASMILEKLFPEECKAAGPNLVSDAIAGVEVQPPEEGQPFPLMEVFDFLKDAAQFILAAYGIYKAWKELHNGKPTLSELRSEINEKVIKGRRLTPEQKDKIIREIISRE